MLTRLTANQPTFKPVEFSAPFGFVLASPQSALEHGETLNPQGTTNGSGKSLLVKLVQFCLGGGKPSEKPWNQSALQVWEFSLGFEFEGRAYSARRAVNDFSSIYVDGDFSDWEQQPVAGPDGQWLRFGVEQWKLALGSKLYDLPPDRHELSLGPTPRTLLSYAARPEDGFTDAFRFHPKQRAYQTNGANAVFFGLDWRVFQRREQLVQREARLQKAWAVIQEATDDDGSVSAGVGELEANRAALDLEVRDIEGRIAAFRIHPDYTQEQQRAAQLTTDIHDIQLTAVQLRERAAFYMATLEDERMALTAADIAALYSDLGLTFPQTVMRTYEEAESFYSAIVLDRRSFLSDELTRLYSEIDACERAIRERSDARSRILSELEQHGALSDFQRLQTKHASLAEERGRVVTQIEQLRQVEAQLSELRIAIEQLKVTARAELATQPRPLERVKELFSELTHELYGTAGLLVVDINAEGGLRLDVQMRRAASQGHREMAVFCFDLAVTISLQERGIGPGFLIHDSKIFDGVDPRQKVRAIEIARARASQHGFRYVVCMNDGDVPWDGLSEDLRSAVYLSLTDTVEGGLLGIEF